MSDNNVIPDIDLKAAVREFMRLESAGGILLLSAAVLAMVVANSPLATAYDAVLNLRVGLRVGEFDIDKPLLLWINDGLMAIFFFLIGLEIKREVMEGELSSASQIVLPGLGAIGGMVVPAAIYVWFNWSDPVAMDGWAIPVATDIAFALGLLSLFGERVPTALKVFLLTLAIFDDLAAIIIIALFYSGDLSPGALIIGGAALALAAYMNYRNVMKVSVYILIGIVLWVAVLKSGVHATLAGVLIALCIPMRDEDGHSPLRDLEDDLHTPVAFAILPIFAFANAGLTFAGLSLESLLNPVAIGITTGLVLGKPLGIMLFVGAGIAIGIASKPKDLSWMQLTAVACTCGIGFTMSLFIAGLAFERTGGAIIIGDRLSILTGSIVSALIAYLLLRFTLPGQTKDDT